MLAVAHRHDLAVLGSRSHLELRRHVNGSERVVATRFDRVVDGRPVPAFRECRLIEVGRSVIVSAVRTPFGRLGGGLAHLPATELGAVAIRAALERVAVDPGEVEYVIMGQVLQAGAGQAPARQAAVGAGIPKEVPADTINKVCASSVRAIQIADLMVRAGGHELVVTGGMESMSKAPYLLPKARFGYRLGNGEILDHMVFDGLSSTFDGLHMVQQASKVSRELGISREEQDEWAYRSHQRAAAAQDDGKFADELVPVGDVTADEGVRRETTLEKLAALEPVFDPDGSTTAGNAPGVNDGASCVVVCSEEFATRRGLEPLATILAQGYVADDYAYLARTPARAGEQALAKAGKKIGDVKRVEINEAFASVAKNSTRMLGADEALVNVNGGAVALGHPIGASGGRIVSTLVHELAREGGGLGLVAICSGGGQGDALLIEV
jgi:acetyl-CoA C-acetyltransferase